MQMSTVVRKKKRKQTTKLYINRMVLNGTFCTACHEMTVIFLQIPPILLIKERNCCGNLRLSAKADSYFAIPLAQNSSELWTVNTCCNTHHKHFYKNLRYFIDFNENKFRYDIFGQEPHIPRICLSSIFYHPRPQEIHSLNRFYPIKAFIFSPSLIPQTKMKTLPIQCDQAFNFNIC